MNKIFELIKNHWKKAVGAAAVFAVLFAIIFWLVNLDFGQKVEQRTFSEESFAGKLGDEFKEKVGATDVYQISYAEWTNQAGLVSENDKYDDDPDGDGLPNYLEYVHGTDPVKPDTDGDGYSDRQETTNGYDPDAPGDAKPAVTMTIGKINVATPMIWSLSDDETAMQKDLENGVIHISKTAAPGQAGNVVVSGHSSNYIWAPGNYKHIFKDLNSLAPGDTIDVKTVQRNGRAIVYHYKVAEKKIVSPDDPSIFAESDTPVLTLTTCWPLGTNLRRLIVKADLVK